MGGGGKGVWCNTRLDSGPGRTEGFNRSTEQQHCPKEWKGEWEGWRVMDVGLEGRPSASGSLGKERGPGLWFVQGGGLAGVMVERRLRQSLTTHVRVCTYILGTSVQYYYYY